jgi:hypothetical protein
MDGRSVAKLTPARSTNLLAFSHVTSVSSNFCLYMACLFVYLTYDYPAIGPMSVFMSRSRCCPGRHFDSPGSCDQPSRLHIHRVCTRRLGSTTRVLLSSAHACLGRLCLVASPLHLFSAPPCVGIPVVASVLSPYKDRFCTLTSCWLAAQCWAHIRVPRSRYRRV